MLCFACADPGSPVALILFIIVFLCTVAAVCFILYQKNKHRFHSTVRYQRNFDDADSTSMINDAEWRLNWMVSNEMLAMMCLYHKHSSMASTETPVSVIQTKVIYYYYSPIIPAAWDGLGRWK